jgi:hypothetical protein
MLHSSTAARRSWLLFLHQVPARPSSLRVRVWRRLLAVGALPLRNGAYVLPDRGEPREDLAWIAADVRALGGQATVLAGAALGEGEDEAIEAAFRKARADDYRALARRAERILTKAGGTKAAGRRGAALQRAEAGLRREWDRLGKVTYFETPEQGEAHAMLERLQGRLRPARPEARSRGEAGLAQPASFRGRTWVTRPRPGIDRMASAWLIRTYVDPAARFAFADRPKGKAVPFDMYEGEFSHREGACTFEVMARRFAVTAEPVSWLARVVHDVDLREERYAEPEAAGIALLVEGLRARHADDHELLEAGIALFAALARGRAARASAGAATRPRGRARRPRAAKR